MAKQEDAITFLRASTGPFTLSLYRRILERIQETGAILTLSVSSGQDERVFFFTRGAILFLATGTSGGHLLERKVLARGLLPREKLQSLRTTPALERPILQEALREERLLDDATIQGMVNEVIEEQLLEVALWDGEVAVYDLIPGNPPPRLYDKRAPAIRLSIGLRSMLAAVIPKVTEIPEKILRPLGGTLKQRMKLVGSPKDLTGDPTEDAILQHVPALGRTGVQVLASAQRAGIPAYHGALALASLVAKRRIQVETARELTREEQVEAADVIEKSLEVFVNRLIARQHLATIYEKLDDKERAGDHLREIAGEYVERDRLDDAMESLQRALGLVPKDLAAREGLVKVLTSAKRPTDAAKEATQLGQMLLELALPGRAKNAFALAAKLMPRSLDILWKLATLSETLGDKDEAIRRYEEIAEVARQADDRVGVISAKQRILAIDPKNKKAITSLRAISGYRSALMTRGGVAGAAVLVALVLGSSSFYEVSAASAWTESRDAAWVAFDQGKTGEARSTLTVFAKVWPHARAAGRVDSVLQEIDREDRVRAELVAARAADEARLLEEAGSIPEALLRWRAAADAERDPEKKSSLVASRDRCLALAADADSIIERARTLREQGHAQDARELLAVLVRRSPWIAGRADFTVPCRIETIPPGLRVQVDGHELAGDTPATGERGALPGELIVHGKHGERVLRELEAVPPWPVVVAFPRAAAWTQASVQATAAPALAEGRLVVAGRDRCVTVVKRETGEVVWRHSLGVFGDMAVTPALIPDGKGGRLVVVRTADGTVIALDEAKGTERWRTSVLRPPGAGLGRPVALPATATAPGVVVREGVQGLALLRATDGTVAWRAKVPDDVTGEVAVGGDLAVVAHGTKLAAFDASRGTARWDLALAAAPTCGPAIGPRGTVFAPLKGQLARFEPSGAAASDPEPIKESVTAIEADDQHVILGTETGFVVTLDARGKLAHRRPVAKQPVSWVGGTSGLVLVQDGSGLVVLDYKLVEVWRDLTSTGPAAADRTSVYAVGPRGLSAIRRE